MKTKVFLFFCFFFFLLLPKYSWAAELDAEELTLGGIRLGDTIEQVESVYGEPWHITYGVQGFLDDQLITLLTYDYGSSFRIRFDADKGRVYDIFVGADEDDFYDIHSYGVDTSIKMANGIRIGSDRAELEAVYGVLPMPYVSFQEAPTCAYIYEGEGAKLAFFIMPEQSTKIAAIHLVATDTITPLPPMIPISDLETPEHMKMRQNFLPPSDDFLAELAFEQSLPYTKGKTGAARFYADNDRPIYPANDGAVGHIATITLRSGQVILSRYGAATGRYVSPQGTPFGQRALPSTTDKNDFHLYVVLRDIEGVEKGKIAPWFGQAGGGIQYKLPERISQLLAGKEPFLEEVFSDDSARSDTDSKAA